jgi:hypothetical protein
VLNAAFAPDASAASCLRCAGLLLPPRPGPPCWVSCSWMATNTLARSSACDLGGRALQHDARAAPACTAGPDLALAASPPTHHHPHLDPAEHALLVQNARHVLWVRAVGQWGAR